MNTSDIDTSRRCNAILKSVYKWRCRRDATGPDGLCAQHRALGCTVPREWNHWVNAHGVLTCEPLLPYEHIESRARKREAASPREEKRQSVG